MPNIVVELPAALQPLAGGVSEVTLSGEKVGDILQSLMDTHQAVGQRVLSRGGELRAHVHVFIDEDDVRHLDGLDTAIDGYRRLVIVPSVAGG